jgi:hypothetical protein
MENAGALSPTFNAIVRSLSRKGANDATRGTIVQDGGRLIL